jgi:hypothetical protein
MLDEGDWSQLHPGHIPPRRKPGAHWRGGWVVTRVDMNDLEMRNLWDYWKYDTPTARISTHKNARQAQQFLDRLRYCNAATLFQLHRCPIAEINTLIQTRIYRKDLKYFVSYLKVPYWQVFAERTEKTILFTEDLRFLQLWTWKLMCCVVRYEAV